MESENINGEYSIDHLTLEQLLFCYPKNKFDDIVNTNSIRLKHLAKLLKDDDIKDLKILYDGNYADDEGKWPKTILQTRQFLRNSNQNIPDYPENPDMNQKLEYLRLFLILMFENDDTFFNPPIMKKTKTKSFIQGFRRLQLQRTGLSVNNVRELMNCTFEKDNLNDLIIKINENIMSERDINRANREVRDSLRKKNTTIRLLSELVEKVQSDDNYQNVNIDNLRNHFNKYYRFSLCS